MDQTEKRLIFWWAMLTAVTLVSFISGDAGQFGAAISIVMVVALAFAKTWIVMMQFMEARVTPLPLKLTLTAYVIVVGGAVAVIWLL